MDWGGAYAFVCYGALAVAVIAAIGVFAYGRILSTELATKNTTLAQAQSGIDQQTVESFLRLHDRLAESETLIQSHTELSNALALFSTILPSTVRLNSVSLSVDGTNGEPTVTGGGVAKDFNALAAASAAFGANKFIQNAIFSRLAVNRDNSVTFSLSATLDPKLIAYTASAGTANAPVPAQGNIATSTPGAATSTKP